MDNPSRDTAGGQVVVGADRSLPVRSPDYLSYPPSFVQGSIPMPALARDDRRSTHISGRSAGYPLVLLAC